ncbi:HAD family hydrolase [Ensifer aridi]|uniref:HAD family hydrolase n=1 Tax=Ensifer aridi TaxID=1708715 RepID=UPI000411DB44|nr:HAD family phosphatase [Ensifer aridi]
MPLPRIPQAIIFDMDGLIFDTEVLYRDAVLSAARSHGREMPVSLYLETIGLSGEATRVLFRDHFGHHFDFDRFWTRAVDLFHEMADTRLGLKPGVVELLDLLDEKKLPRAIATSSRHQDVKHHLAFHALEQRFSAVVAHGDYERGKPHPDPFLKAAACLGVEPEFCLALEDSHNGIRSASSAGMMTIMVPDLLPPTEEIRGLCMHVAPDLHTVGSMLRAIR